MSKKSKLTLMLQFPDQRLQKQLSKKWLKNVVQSALLSLTAAPTEITLRFVNAEEGRILNRDYRGKDYPTNVLTFAYHEHSEEMTQADIILCTDVLQHEAESQNKSILDHAVHLIVHGVLHAQGYDHENDDEAVEMEALEVEILSKLGIKDPYKNQPANRLR